MIFFRGFDMSILISTFRSLETKNILISKGGSCKEVSRAKVQERSHGKAGQPWEGQPVGKVVFFNTLLSNSIYMYIGQGCLFGQIPVLG